MLSELTRLANRMLCLHDRVANPAAAGTRVCDEASTTRKPWREPRGIPHHGDWHLVEWLLLAVIWSGTLLLLSRTVLGLVLMA